MYFSIKCGQIFKRYAHDKLSVEEQNFVDMFIDAVNKKDTEIIDSYFESGYFDYETTLKLYKIAEDKVEQKIEKNELSEGDTVDYVSEVFSAIEIQHFCKNYQYQNPNQELPLVSGIFWELITPMIFQIHNIIGSKYLYLFAADLSQSNSEKQSRRLLKYYKNELKFSDVEDISILKPHYDRGCIALVQSIDELKENYYNIWDTYFDAES